MTVESSIAPGSRIRVRDAEWLVRRVDTTSTGEKSIEAVGLSELVEDEEARFLTDIDDIEEVDPADTNLVQDDSPGYRESRLYLESLLRQKSPTEKPTEGHLYLGHEAAMDEVPYQLEPAIDALQKPRARVLIADAVGLGKTVEAGVLISELIRRGRGRRILVVGLKSMLGQLQKEFWNRFTIPLTRLDSRGIQRIKSRIPANHNPFYYYDRTIISIDTLKQDSEYRTYIEDSHWDVIVIDEAQHVARRGTISQRAELAELLAQKSDALIMLSATPHDGSPESFASLMNMLDPTAISDPSDYGPDDIEGLFRRRFKKDIKHQVRETFPERKTYRAEADASPAEEEAFDFLTEMEFSRIDRERGSGALFRTQLQKSLFSSPAACLQTIRNRKSSLEEEQTPEAENDYVVLQELEDRVEAITPDQYTKYQKLLELLDDEEKPFHWTGDDPDDRLIVFTERIETLKFLREQIIEDRNLDDEQVAVLHGSMSDVEQQEVVERFGQDDDPVRLLIASDIASEGINLHFLCHHLVHFDIPWSLMKFQQRNGRIDRYGQEREPRILYLKTNSRNEKIHGDQRILDILIEKDKQANENIGDPRSFMGVYDIEEEEKIVAAAMEEGQSEEEFSRELDANQEEETDFLELIMEDEDQPLGDRAMQQQSELPSLFNDHYKYVKTALRDLFDADTLQWESRDEERSIVLTANDEIDERLEEIPDEAYPDDGRLVLSGEPSTVMDEIKASRREENPWPDVHYLWPLHPLVQWVNDRVLASFERHEAPVLAVPGLENDNVVYLVSGLIPNRRGHPLVHHWFGVHYREDEFVGFMELDRVLSTTGIMEDDLPNPGLDPDTERLEERLDDVIDMAKEKMSEQRETFKAAVDPKLDEHLRDLEEKREEQHRTIEQKYADSDQPEALRQSNIENEKTDVDRDIENYIDWIEDAMTTEDRPNIRVLAVFHGTE